MSPSTSRQVFLDSGRYLMLQGEPSDSFFILKKGRLEVLMNDGSGPFREEDVERDGRLVAVLERSNLPIGEIGAIEGTPRSASVRARERSELIQVAGGPRAVTEWIRSNLSAGLLLARTLCARVRSNHLRWHAVRLTSKRASAYIDNFSILYSILNTRIPEPNSTYKFFLDHGRNLIARMDQARPPALADVDREVPPEDIPAPLNRPFAEIEEAYFFSHILSRPPKELEWLVQNQNPHPLEYISHRLARTLPRLSEELHREMREAEEVLDRFYGPRGILRAYVYLFEGLDSDQRRAALPFLKRLLEVARRFEAVIARFWRTTFPNASAFHTDLELLDAVLQGKTVSLPDTPASSDAISEPLPAGASPSRPPRPSPAPTPPSPPSAKPPLKAAEKKSTVPETVAEAEPAEVEVVTDYDFPGALSEMKLNSMERDALRLCLEGNEDPNRVFNAYWNLWPRLWQLSRTYNRKEIRGFLRYGFAPSQPIPTPERLSFDEKTSGPVMYGDQWIRLIYEEKVGPSRNDLGQTIDEYLKANRLGRYRSDEPDPAMDNVYYEVEQVLAKAARAFSAGRGEVAVIRRTPEEIADTAERILTPGKTAETLIRLVRIDFTAFYRDVRFQIAKRSDFLPKEIYPFVLILPSEGDRGISWQEFEGRNKDSPGRILLPELSVIDLFDMMIGVVARFRWNIAKAIAGANWMSPADGGLTGHYYDYVNFYKKNPELSDEQKQKLNDRFAGLSMDADKFALDYSDWIKFESQGIQKLNKVSRRIFIEYCPFALPIRKKLRKHPAFRDLLHKDSNKRLKKRQELERRIYKLEREGFNVENAFDGAFKIYEPFPEE
ncbi:MAG: cyclic nucleotide-binding domain-containing protein [Candidatus Hydrogenedentota bacterium]|nr:MAG: cyclic nucleotide-binding domain-containing protein [Candidatus Hydrogenedentota bacterium]